MLSKLVASVTGVTVAAIVMAHSPSAQNRVRRSIAGPVTADSVTRALHMESRDRALVLGPSSSAGDSVLPEVSLVLRIAFPFDSAALSAGAMGDLDAVAAALLAPQLQSTNLTLEGHTDAVGDEHYNLRLSQRRADAVVGYLVQRGVPATRLRAVGFGESRPLPGPSPTDGRQRRVEIVRAF